MKIYIPIPFHDEETYIKYVSDFIDSFQNLTYKSLGMYVLYTYEEKKFKIANV